MHRLFSTIIISVFYLSFAQQATGQVTKFPPLGPHDTIRVSTIYYDNEWIPYGEMPTVYITNGSYDKMAKVLDEYNRLRNAVYVTYPYARTAGYVINDVNSHMQGMSRGDRKKYIKSREKDLKKQFSDPLSNLSVYQGKVLMKLINRETNNNCYDIIKDYRGGFNARMYQTVAFFFGSSLKQDYDIAHDKTDRQIEHIVNEINGYWYNNPYKPGISPQK
jgi:Domain of unknown function (DUF4294)